MLISRGSQHSAGVDGVFSGVRLGSRGCVVGGRVALLVGQVRGGVIAHHSLIIIVRTLGRLFLLLWLRVVRMCVGCTRVVGVNLRR